MTSTLPFNPFGSFRGIQAERDELVAGRRLAVTPCDLKAFTTAFRFEDVAPHLLCSVDSEGYFP